MDLGNEDIMRFLIPGSPTSQLLLKGFPTILSVTLHLSSPPLHHGGQALCPEFWKPECFHGNRTKSLEI